MSDSCIVKDSCLVDTTRVRTSAYSSSYSSYIFYLKLDYEAFRYRAKFRIESEGIETLYNENINAADHKVFIDTIDN